MTEEKMETPRANGAIGPACAPGLEGTPGPAGDSCPFDEPMLAALAEFDQQAQSIEAQRIGALRLFMRQRGLDGEWMLSADRRALVPKKPAA
jgi:hypothetical protein